MIRIAAIACNKTEDIELITPVDLWRRAGIRVDIISLEKKNSIVLNSGIKISCDTMIERANLEQYNAIFLPGGAGHEKYFIESWPNKNNEGVIKLHKFLNKFNDAKKHILAICAAPTILGYLGILKDRKATCYPGFETHFKDTYIDVPFHIDGHIITARSPAIAMEFAYAVIRALCNSEMEQQIRDEVIDNYAPMPK